MTILSFKPKGRGGGCGAPERHIVFKLKAQLLFPRQVSLPPPRARGRQPSDGIVIHQGPVTAAEGLTPPSPGSPRLGSALHPAKVTPPAALPRALSILRSSRLFSSLLSPSVSTDPCSHQPCWFSSSFAPGHPSSVPGPQGSTSKARPKGKLEMLILFFWGEGKRIRSGKPTYGKDLHYIANSLTGPSPARSN